MKKKKLRIAQVAPLWLPIPPLKYGGTEWVVYHLCEGLKAGIQEKKNKKYWQCQNFFLSYFIKQM